MSSGNAPNTRKPTWREVLNQEFRKILSSETPIWDLTESQIQINRKLIKHALHSFASLVVPLTITFLLVVLIMANFSFFKESTYIFAYYTPFEEKTTDTTTTKIGTGITNALIFAVVVIVQTVILYLLYKYKFYKIINGFLNLSIFFMLFSLTLFIFLQVLVFLNIEMDLITFYLILINYSVVGMLSIFTTISHSVQKCYHIILSAFIGCFLIRIFPEVTGWIVLAVLVVWDLIAVLTPFGPLKLLVETASERGESLFPALIFKTMVELEPDFSLPLENIFTVQDSYSDSATSEQLASGSVHESDNDDYEGSSLGLGDFIFFGILMGKVSLLENMNALFACYVSIILGFLITYLILITLGQALPALPASLILGLAVYFSFFPFASPYLNYLTTNKLII